MLRIILLLLISFFVADTLVAQQKVVPAIIINGDTLPHIVLQEVIVKGKRKGKSQAWHRRYDQRRARLEYNVKKVYPYAKMAARKIAEIEERLKKIKHDSERKVILKQEYAELMKSFKEPLKKLSVTQGRILIRLIYRETNNTSFAHIREYKGKINAYFWQSLALLFGNNLKAKYDPYGDDYEIEEIIEQIKRGEI